MITYLRQPRVVRLLDEREPSFPARVAIRFRCMPAQLFGASEGPIRAVRLGSAYNFVWDASTDRKRSHPTPGFSQVTLTLPCLEGEFEVHGNDITFKTNANSESDLENALQFLQFALPASLSAILPDPVYITDTDGMIGGIPFRVEHIQSTTPVVVLTDEKLTDRIADALSNLELMADKSGMRLFAASRYVHTAFRLLAAGYSAWEFMPEALLNYSKALEILFGESRDLQRAGMRAIGISESDIHARFIPITVLRDFLDVAHPKLSQLDRQRLNGLYLFLVELEPDFQHLLRRARGTIATGAWTPLAVTSTDFDSADLRKIDRILAADRERRQQRESEIIEGRQKKLRQEDHNEHD